MNFLDSNSILWVYLLLIVGIVCVSLAIAGIYTGKTWGRWGEAVSRANDPWSFWILIVGYYLLGIYGIARFGLDLYGSALR